MKNIIVISKKDKNIGKEYPFYQEYNIVLSEISSIIDLPNQVSDILIDNDKITFKVISWCMFPIIWAGDFVKVKSIKPEEARIGDIVFYKSVGRAYCHRLVKIYMEKDKLYIATSGEKEYRDNQFSSCTGITADNILGKVMEVKRGRLCLRPDKIKLSSQSLIQGRLKLSLWILTYGIKQYIAKVFIELQKVKLCRSFLRRFINNKILFFVGTPVIKSIREINNFCFYRKFDDFFQDFKDSKDIKGLYNISARINNRAVGNISLYFEKVNNYQVCTLANLIVSIRFRGGGIGRQLAEKAIFLCSKIKVDEIRIILSEEAKIAVELFKKLGFNILE